MSTYKPKVVPRIDPNYCVYKIEIRESSIHRWGVFAAEKIPARRKVIEYTGERINRKETKRRSEGALIYLFEVSPYWCLDGAVGGSGAELINHSCEANLYSSVMKGHILYFSRRAIHPGEELTVDYRFDKKVEKVPCRCGSKKCRGTINLIE
ncbi:MAG: SET domain-containing protein-lysine N-methyltransferase [Bryobacteraceae bacterium]